MNADRVTASTDGVFAVIVTVMVLELKAPDQPSVAALWPRWPTAIRYTVSFLFIAIIWINPALCGCGGRRAPNLHRHPLLYAGLFVCVDSAQNTGPRRRSAEVMACETGLSFRNFDFNHRI